MDRLVSIMIPTYNQPEYIEQAVKSALNQDYPNIEVIVSDDSNNEQTGIVLKPFLTDSRFSYHKNPKQLGRVQNYRKLLFELAKGEWVVMLDGDDYYIDDHYISKAMQIASKEKSVVLIGSGIKVLKSETNSFEKYGISDKDLLVDGKEMFTKYTQLPNHQTDVYQRRLACELDFYRDPSAGSDSESLYRLCLHGKVAYIAGEPAVWRVHNENTTYTRNIGKQIKELKFIDSIYSYALNFLNKKDADAWRRNMYRGMTAHLLNLSLTLRSYKYSILLLLRFGKFIGLKQSINYCCLLFANRK